MTDAQFEEFVTILLSTQIPQSELTRLLEGEEAIDELVDEAHDEVIERRHAARRLAQVRRRLRRRHREIDEDDFPAARNVEQALDIVEETLQTRVLSDADEAFLHDDANAGVIANRLRAQIEARSYLDQRLSTFFSDQSTSNRLVECLLMVLHVHRIVDAKRRHELILQAFIQCIILTVLITSHRHDRALIQARRELYRIVRSEKQALLRRLNRMVDDTDGFFMTYQSFYHRQLDALWTLKEDWKKDHLLAVNYLHLPTTAEMESFYAIRHLEKEKDYAQRVRASLVEQRQAVVALIRTRGTPRKERRILGEERDQYGELISAQRAQISRRNREIARRRQQLGQRRYRYAEQYYQMLAENRYNPNEAQKRDMFLSWADAQISHLTSHRLWRDNEQERWTIYSNLLEKLVTKHEMVSIDVLVDAYLQRYGKINANRNMAFYRSYKGHTYPGHPDGAVDIIITAGTDIYIIAPPTLTLPHRLMKELPDTPDQIMFRYQRSTIGQTPTQVTSDLQDIFAKLAFGLLRSRGNQRTSSREIGHVMEQHGGDVLAPEYVSQSESRNFEVRRIISGLAFRRLTEDYDSVPAIDRERENILLDWERLIVAALQLPTDTVIFRRDRRDAHAGHVGVGRLITFRDSERDINLGTILTTAQRILESPQQSAHEQRYRNGLVHRIWRLMNRLRTNHNVEANRRAQSVTINHHYIGRHNGQEIPLMVGAYHTHLSAVEQSVRHIGEEINLGIPLGKVGMTGNAISSHLHIEIQVRLNNRNISPMYPHEFYPLYDVFPMPESATSQH